jgi:hypothetical protein
MMFIAEGMEEELENKAIRYELYRFVAKKLWGPLGKGFRKKIPHCIMAEIHDAYPAKEGTSYVGFKRSAADAGLVEKQLPPNGSEIWLQYSIDSDDEKVFNAYNESMKSSKADCKKDD